MQEKNKIASEVMEKIEKGEVKMTPKYYFVVGSVLVGVGLAGSMMGISFLTHIILFRMRADRPIFMLMEREHGMAPVMNFPWLMFGFFLALTFLGIKFLKQYEISYKRNLRGILIAGMTFVVVLGCLMDRMGVERELQKVPTFRRVYGEQRLAPRQVPGAQQPAVRGFQKMRLR